MYGLMWGSTITGTGKHILISSREVSSIRPTECVEQSEDACKYVEDGGEP